MTSNGHEPTDDESYRREDWPDIDALSPEEVAAIDRALLLTCDHVWRKVAFVVGYTMSADKVRARSIPDVYYAQRVRKLVADGLLEADGNLSYMRYSEVRRTPGAIT